MKCTLTISGHVYTVETGEDSEERIKKCAAFVDSQLCEVAAAIKTLDTNKIMIITLLEMAKKYFDLKEKSDSKAFDFSKEIESFNSSLEEMLK